MTRLKIEVVGEDDAAATRVLRKLMYSMESFTHVFQHPSYTVSDTIGNAVADVVRFGDKCPDCGSDPIREGDPCPVCERDAAIEAMLRDDELVYEASCLPVVAPSGQPTHYEAIAEYRARLLAKIDERKDAQ